MKFKCHGGNGMSFFLYCFTFSTKTKKVHGQKPCTNLFTDRRTIHPSIIDREGLLLSIDSCSMHIFYRSSISIVNEMQRFTTTLFVLATRQSVVFTIFVLLPLLPAQPSPSLQTRRRYAGA